MQPEDRCSFQVAIICALTVEANAVEAAFDEFWDEGVQRYGKSLNDQNSYSFGRIGHHPVVLAHMAGMGKVDSARVAANCRSSFPNIRLSLVVGVCGGVPRPSGESPSEEIFLGDVIISTGVKQLDFGRRGEKEVIRKDTLEDNLGRPAPEIRSYLKSRQTFRARRDFRDRVTILIEEICANGDPKTWSRPPLNDDKLYQADYLHKHHDPKICGTCAGEIEGSCDRARKLSCADLQCDEQKLVARVRESDVPQLHFGYIGSADFVERSGTHRDRLSAGEDILGFEMEGAGVWDSFPTIIIKGVCDYSDSHKNKHWQIYASVTAAACMKWLLQNWVIHGQTLSISNHEESKRISSSGQHGGVVFNNYGKVNNQAASQTFSGSVTFN